jgi:hypothetical protein
VSFTRSLSFNAPHRNPVSASLLPIACHKPHPSYFLYLSAQLTFGKRIWPKACGNGPAGSALRAGRKFAKSRVVSRDKAEVRKS